MIWLTWRQHRRQALFTLLGLVALAAFVVPTGLSMRHAFTQLGLADCVTTASLGCAANTDKFSSTYGSLVLVSVLLLVVPLLIGLFWGAPVIAREVEQGTHRMIWTQGISRRHWALVKCALLGSAVTLFALVYGLGMSWWYQPLGQIDVRQTRFTEVFFDMQGVAPAGYTLFAVALGVYAGTALPKVLPAMAVTLAGFVGVRVAVALLARPHYMTPEVARPAHRRRNRRTGQPRRELGAGQGGPSGRRHLRHLRHRPVPDSPTTAASDAGLRPGAYNHQVFQPADRFWTFQWIETGVFVALAALLLWLTIRRIRRIA